MTNIFDQEGITFSSASMASTSPSAQPDPIKAPTVDLAAAPSNTTPAAPTTSQAAPTQNNGDAVPDQRDYLTQLTEPQPPADGSTAAGAAPPQPQDNSQGVNIFKAEGIPDVPRPGPTAALDISQSNQAALTAGIDLPAPVAPVNSIPSKGGMSQVDFGAREAAGDTDAQRAADFATETRNSNISLARKLYGDDQVNQWLKNPIGAVENIERLSAKEETLPFLRGANDATQDVKLMAIAYKNSTQQPLSDSEKQYADNYLHDQLEESVRGYTRAGKLAGSLVTLPAWMIEYASGEAAAKFALVGTKIASPALDSLAHGAVTAVFLPTQYVAGYAESQMNASTAVTDKGMRIAKQSTESPALSAAMSMGYVASDVASMHLMPGISKYIAEPATKLLSTPIIAAAKNLPPALQEGLYNAYKAIDPNASFSKFMTPQGYTDALTAIGSFQVDKILRGTVTYAGTPEKFSDFVKGLPLDEDDLLVAGALTAAHGTMSSSHAIMTSMLRNRDVDPAKAEETASQMSATEKDAFVNDNINLPKSEYPTAHSDETPSPKQAISVLEQKAEAHESAAAAQRQEGDHDAADNSMLRASAFRDSAQRVQDTGFISAGGMEADSVFHADTTGTGAGADIVNGGMKEAQSADPALINEPQSGFNRAFKTARLYSEWFHDLTHLEALGKLAQERGALFPGLSEAAKAKSGKVFNKRAALSPFEASLSLAKSTAALTEEQWTTRTTSWDKNGNKVTTGKGLKQIGDDYDNAMLTTEPDVGARAKDMYDFRKAMTFIEDKNKGYNPVSEKDFTESQATLTRLADKYGEKMPIFETFAKEYRDWDNRILHNLVTSGLKTQAWYDDLAGKREWYSSTARVVESEYPLDVARAEVARRIGMGENINPRNIGALKERKGSEREVQNQVTSSMRNSAIIMRKAALNKAKGDIAAYAKYYPEKVKIENPRVISQKVEHDYDPKLRTKLEQAVEFLGGEVKRIAQGGKVGDKKSNRGAYQPATKAIYLRQGSTEGTLTHEAGHMLDYVLGLKERLLGDPEMKAELQKLSEDRLRSEVKLQQTPEGKTEFAAEFEQAPKKYVDYVKSDREVLANLFDAWVNSPEQAKAIAPKAVAAFEKLIDDNPQLALLREIRPSTQRASETIQKSLLDYEGPKNSTPFYDKGQLKFLVMDEDTAKAFNSLDQVSQTMTNNFIKNIGLAQAKMLHFGAINNPYFVVRHFFRATQGSYVNTPDIGLRDFFNHFAVEIPKGIGDVLGKSDLYRDWAGSSGALRTFMDTSDDGMNKLKYKMMDKMDYNEFLNPLNWAQLTKDGAVHGWYTAKEVSDYAPRIAVYNQLKAKGYSDMEAGYLSLESTGNYIRHGSVIKEVNKYVPFLNDRIQGADRFARAVMRDPLGYAVKGVALITMPQLLVTGYYLFAASDEDRKEYLNLSDFRRNTSMNIKIAGQWVPFPRAFAPGYAFGALPEHAMIHFFAKDAPALKHFWLNMIGDTISSLSPSVDYTQSIPPLLKASLEKITNYSFFRHTPLFHGDINNTAPENQSNASTSETAKMLSKTFGGVLTPVQIDNTVYDMGAHIGVYATQLSDMAINKTRSALGQPVNEKPTKGSDNPLYGPLMQPAPIGTASQSFQEFNEHVHDLNQQENRFKELKGDYQADFRKENKEDLVIQPRINAINTEVSHAEHEIRIISENTNLTGDQKAEQIQRKQVTIETLIEGGNRYYRAGEEKK